MRVLLNSLLVLLLLAAPALAEPTSRDDDRLAAKAKPEASQLARTERFDTGLLDRSIRLELVLPAYAWTDPLLTGAPRQYRLPEQLPEVVFLSFTPIPACTLYVTAYMDEGLPRLDAVDGDTFFTTGVELHVTPQLSLFAEDFQPSSMVLAEELEHPVPFRSWDGHQVGVGARWKVTPRVAVEAQTVFYVLSASRRHPGAGGVVSVTLLF